MTQTQFDLDGDGLLDPDDPTSGGSRLQLPIYARAARDAFGAPDTAVGAAY